MKRNWDNFILIRFIICPSNLSLVFLYCHSSSDWHSFFISSSFNGGKERAVQWENADKCTHSTLCPQQGVRVFLTELFQSTAHCTVSGGYATSTDLNKETKIKTQIQSTPCALGSFYSLVLYSQCLKKTSAWSVPHLSASTCTSLKCTHLCLLISQSCPSPAELRAPCLVFFFPFHLILITKIKTL